MNVFWQELKIDRKAFALWLLGMLFLIGACVGKMSGMVDENSAALSAMLMLLPPSLRGLFGLGAVDYSQPIGIFGVVAVYIALVASLHAAGLGAGAFAREERDKTFEFLYVKGRSRTAILSAKVLSGCLQLLLLNWVSYGFGALFTRVALGADVARGLLPIMAGILSMQCLFYAAGLLASLLTRRMQIGLSAASGLVMALFFAALACDLGAPAFWGYLTPFHLFDGKVILREGLNGAAAAICLALAAAMVGASFLLHDRRDLRC